MQGNQANRSVLLNSKVIDYVNFILRASEFPTCSAEKVRRDLRLSVGAWYSVGMRLSFNFVNV